MAYLNTENLLEQFAGFLMVMLPEPRIDYYQSSDFHDIKSDVLDYMNQIVEACGTYPVTMSNSLLTVM